MPSLPTLAPSPLVFRSNPALLHPKFELYKLSSDPEPALASLNLPFAPSRPQLPLAAKVSYAEIRHRTGWNSLSAGVNRDGCLYIGDSGCIVRIRASGLEIEGEIPLRDGELRPYESDKGVKIWPYYPSVREPLQGIFITTDGQGKLWLQNKKDRMHPQSISSFMWQDIPFILLDATAIGVDDHCDILICFCNPKSNQKDEEEVNAAKPPMKKYTVLRLRISTAPSSTSMITPKEVSRLEGTDIPKHSVFLSSSRTDGPNILLYSTAPFYYAPAIQDSEGMAVDEPLTNETEPPQQYLTSYTFTQSPTSLTISIPLPQNVKQSDVILTITSHSLQLTFSRTSALHEFFPLGNFLSRPLWDSVDVNQSTWTLSLQPDGMQILDIELEKKGHLQNPWPHIFSDRDDGVVGYGEEVSRREALQNLLQGVDVDPREDDAEQVRRRFMLEEDEDIDLPTFSDSISFFTVSQSNLSPFYEKVGEEVIGLSFAGNSIGLKNGVDMLSFTFDPTAPSVPHHDSTFPALSFIASSKTRKRFVRYTEKFVVIQEQGSRGNTYVYYRPKKGEDIGKQIVVQANVDAVGIEELDDGSVVLLGEGEEGKGVAVIITGL